MAKIAIELVAIVDLCWFMLIYVDLPIGNSDFHDFP